MAGTKQLHRLSARRVETLRQPGRFGDGNNLFLSISANGGRRWVFLFRWHGRLVEMGLGSARNVTLAHARAKAAEARQQLAQGVNPLQARRAAEVTARPQAPVTFGEVADQLLAAMEPSRRNAKHHRQWEVALGKTPPKRGDGTYAAPLRSKPVAEITTADILAVLKPVWQTRPEQASRLRQRIEAVLDAAKAAGHREGDNVARWKGHIQRLLPPPKMLSRGHYAAMPFEDVPAFVGQLRASHGTTARCLEFLISCASRSGEARLARWPEVDFDNATWVVPSARMKGGREHRVPLTRRAIEILEEMRTLSTSEFIFAGNKPGRPLSVMSMDMLLRRFGRDDCTLHGFRSSFKDWGTDATTFPREIIEAALSHRVGDATEQAYRRRDGLERRRDLMNAWCRYLDGESGVVMHLHAGAGA